MEEGGLTETIPWNCELEGHFCLLEFYHLCNSGVLERHLQLEFHVVATFLADNRFFDGDA